MYNAEFFISGGAVVERIVLGVLANAVEADLEAKRLLDGVRLRHPGVVGYRVLNNVGTEVASLRPSHA